MLNNSFIKNITATISKQDTNICVGLDSEYERISRFFKGRSVIETIFEFNSRIIDATHDIVVAYKPNIVFYAGYGIDGLKALKKTNAYIKSKYAEIKIIADCKRSEMKRSAELVAKEIFEEFLFDALTVTPWFGFDTIEPYIKYKGKAVFVLCHDSNPSAKEIQDLELNTGEKVYERVTKLVCNKWNKTGNTLIEAPLTYPQSLKSIYKLSDKRQFFLIAGLGAQEGAIENLAIFRKKTDFIISASRSIIFASEDKDFDKKARNQVLKYNAKINSLF